MRRRLMLGVLWRGTLLPLGSLQLWVGAAYACEAAKTLTVKPQETSCTAHRNVVPSPAAGTSAAACWPTAPAACSSASSPLASKHESPFPAVKVTYNTA